MFQLDIAIISTKFDFCLLRTATGTGKLSVEFKTYFFISRANGEKCDTTVATCDIYAAVMVNGDQVCWTKTYAGQKAVHGTFGETCKTDDIPNNARVSIVVWDVDHTDKKQVVADWVIQPSDFDVGNKLFIGENSRMIRGREQRNRLHTIIHWTPTK